MINASELRIGNTVLGVNGYEKNITPYDYEHTDFNKLNPIPLTPQILEKCGFENNGSNFFIKDGYSVFFYPEDMTFEFQICGNIPDINLNSLHHLQNIHFALTGTELTYKP